MEKKKSGIYCIENLINGKKYVGSGLDVEKRMNENHRECKALRGAIKKYGKDNFKRYVIECCKKDIMIKREAFWIEKLHSHVSEQGYNIMRRNELTKRTGHSDDTKEKISKKKTGVQLSDETCLAMSEGHKGLHPSEETRKKMGEWQRGENNNRYGWKPKSDEEREILSKIHSGKNNGFYGRHHSEESIEKIRMSKIGRHHNNKTKLEMSKNRKGKCKSKKQKNTSSQYFGVSELIRKNKYFYWQARITENGENKYIKHCKIEEEAARAYDKYVVEHSLPNPLNFPEEYGRVK